MTDKSCSCGTRAPEQRVPGILPHLPHPISPGQSPLLTLQVVVVGVLGHPAVQEGPGEVIHRVLLVFYGLGDNLSVEVVVHAVVQVRLHGQGLVEEFLEEILKQGRGRGEGINKPSTSSIPEHLPGCRALSEGCISLPKCPRQEMDICRPEVVPGPSPTFLDPWHMMTQRPSSSCSGRLAWPTICSTS